MTTDSFEWTSDTEEAWDRKLTFSLSTYSTLNAVELQFATGETYIFDLWLYDDRVSKFNLDPTSSVDPHTSIEVSFVVACTNLRCHMRDITYTRQNRTQGHGKWCRHRPMACLA